MQPSDNARLHHILDATNEAIAFASGRSRPGLDALKHLLAENGMDGADLAGMLQVNRATGSKILRATQPSATIWAICGESPSSSFYSLLQVPAAAGWHQHIQSVIVAPGKPTGGPNHR